MRHRSVDNTGAFRACLLGMLLLALTLVACQTGTPTAVPTEGVVLVTPEGVPETVEPTPAPSTPQPSETPEGYPAPPPATLTPEPYPAS